MASEKILIVEDDALMRDMVSETLSRLDYQVLTATCGTQALDIIKEKEVNMVVSDMKMPVMDGIELLKEIRRNYNKEELSFIMITAHGSIEHAVEAMKMGANHFIQKPFEPDVLEHAVKQNLEICSLKKENKKLKEQLQRKYEYIGNSKTMRDISEIVKTVAQSRSTILITGESGTGKELIARAIHVGSKRKDQIFVKINCAAMPDGLIESELFGHEKGAFTGALRHTKGKFELANDGTLLLDEISEMPMQMQAKLLRVLQEREINKVGGDLPVPVDVRIIATTNRDLKESVRKNTFREDLFYRLN
ncbi:MAG: sigma-54 dependent transcriptional regulator, partial [bacterium]